MNQEGKNSILLFGALFATFMLAMQFFLPQQPETEKDETTPSAQRPRPTPTVPSPTTPAMTNGATPATPSATAPTSPTLSEPGSPQTPTPASDAPVGTITVRTKMYEAVFTTTGAALVRYTLLNQYKTPEKKPGEELDLIAPLGTAVTSLGIHSLMIEGQGGLPAEGNLAGLTYRVMAAPPTAKLSRSLGEVTSSNRNSLVFEATGPGGILIRRTYTFPTPTGDETADGRSFGFSNTVVLVNPGSTPLSLNYTLTGPSNIVPDNTENWWAVIKGIAGRVSELGKTDTEVERIPANEYAKEEEGTWTFKTYEYTRNQIAYLGQTNRFFATVLLVANPGITLSARFVPHVLPENAAAGDPVLEPLLEDYPANFTSLLQTHSFSLAPGATVEHQYTFYAGPADDDLLAFDPHLNGLVEYTVSWFTPISRLLVTCLRYVAAVTHNWGLAIILLTILIKSLLHPLTRKGLASTHKMQKIQPLMKKIQAKYKEDRAKQQQEMMRLYRENGVNPVGGCLPMLIQMPIFFALYGAFARSFPMRHASFIPGWIDDLSQPDRLFSWGGDIPYLTWITANDLNLLPIIYLVIQIIQMSMQPKPADPQQASQQKMMKFMPLIFVFIFYKMPAGLVLYFTCQSLFTVIEHWLVKKKLKDGEPQDEPGSPTGPVVVPASVGSSSGKSGGGGSNQKRKKKKKKKK